MASFFAAAAPAATAGDEADRPAVDGVGNGPESSEQPGEVQPVAAVPTKVGEPVPRLVDLTVWVDLTVLVVLATRADAAPPERTTSATGSDNTDSSASDLRTRLGIELHRCGRSAPPEDGARNAPAPAPGGPVRGLIVTAPEGRYGTLHRVQRGLLMLLPRSAHIVQCADKSVKTAIHAQIVADRRGACRPA